jgi:DNA polymerase-3 subunit delta'
MGFSDIIGQDKSLAVLRGALAKNRLHHAYLFTGPQGVGKRKIAISISMALHCMEKSGDPCGHCVECTRITAGNHPDVREIEPLPGKKEISIRQIREAEKELHYRSFTGGRKVAIIDPATLLNPASQNALLKTLEEPPKDSLLFLISPSASAVLPTLRSRCLRVSFGPIPRPLISDFLISNKGTRPEEAGFLAALSMGSLGLALEMEGKELRETRREWVEMLAPLKGGNYRGAIDAAEALASSRDQTLKFLAWAESWYRDLLVYGLRQESGDVVNLDMLPELQRQQAHLGLERSLSTATAASDAGRNIQRNLNRRMVLEQFLFGIVGSR